MGACAPTLAPNRRSTARRHAKQGRGLRRMSHLPNAHATLRACSPPEYLRAARLAAESTRKAEDRSLMCGSYRQAATTALQFPGLALDHVFVDGLQACITQARAAIQKSPPPPIVVQEFQHRARR